MNVSLNVLAVRKMHGCNKDLFFNLFFWVADVSWKSSEDYSGTALWTLHNRYITAIQEKEIYTSIVNESGHYYSALEMPPKIHEKLILGHRFS